MDISIVLAIIALSGTVITGGLQLFSHVKKCNSGCIESDCMNNEIRSD